MEERIFNTKQIYSVKLQFIDFIDEFERLSEVDRKLIVESVSSMLGNKLSNLFAEITDCL